MDCDDLLMRLASPGHDKAQLDEHLASCGSCRELVEVESRPDDREPTENTLVGSQIGPYHVARVLGSGGMGTVYLAGHPEIGSRVAIKVFARDWSREPRLVERFFAEARATNAIAHENIINVLDVGRLDDGRPYLVMEHLLGESLGALIKSGNLTDELVKAVMLDVVGALVAAHAHGIVHRDLKPDNIFVSPSGRATLLDFGVAKLRPELASGAPETVSGVVIGTPHYMAPEQAKGEEIDERADLYAIGVILYECLLGRRPFDGPSIYRLLDQQINHSPIPPRSVRPELAADLERVILTSLEKDREDRFQSARQLRAALEGCQVERGRKANVPSEVWERLAHRDRTAVAEQPRSPSTRASRSRPMVPAILLALVTGVAIVGWCRSSNSPPVSTVRTAETSALVDGDAPGIDTPDIAAPELAQPVPTIIVPAPEKPAPVRTKPAAGIAPLSLVSAATTAALETMPDVVLMRITIRGMTSTGLIDRKATGGVSFDFLSATVASRFENPKTGPCIVRVSYSAAPTPTVERVNAKCWKLQPVPPPRCSMAELLRTSGHRVAWPGLKLPTARASSVATLVMSPTTKRPLWKITVDGVEYSVNAC
jgi:serine/threonine protein kinase